MLNEKQRAQTAARQQRFRERQAQARYVEQQAKGLPPMPAIPTMPGEKRWRRMAEQARVLLQTMQDEMQGYYEARSQEWQEGEKGQAMQERLDTLDQLLDPLDALADGTD